MNSRARTRDHVAAGVTPDHARKPQSSNQRQRQLCDLFSPHRVRLPVRMEPVAGKQVRLQRGNSFDDQARQPQWILR